MIACTIQQLAYELVLHSNDSVHIPSLLSIVLGLLSASPSASPSIAAALLLLPVAAAVDAAVVVAAISPSSRGGSSALFASRSAFSFSSRSA
jgi:hypothetical protein